MTTVREQEKALRARYGGGSWRTASPLRCHQCRAWVLAGLDDDQCAFRAVVDPTPLSPDGEVVALLLGLATYDLERIGAGSRLTRRRARHIRANAAGRPRSGRVVDVVAEHTCAAPVLAAAPSHIPDPADVEAPQETTCPF